MRGRARSGRAVALRPVCDPGPPGRRPRRGHAAAAASVRRLRDPARGRRGQVPDHRLRQQSLQRPPAVRVPDGDGQGLYRSHRGRGGRADRRHAQAKL